MYVIRSFKLIEINTNRQTVCDFLQVVNSDISRISHRFGDIAMQKWSESCVFSPYLPACLVRSPSRCVSVEQGMKVGLRTESLGYSKVKTA